jgi:hypothetical protein
MLSGHFLACLPDPYAWLWLDQGAMRPVAAGALSYEAPLHMAVRNLSRERPAVVALLEDVHDLTRTASPSDNTR